MLADVAQTYQPVGATAIVMNPQNGQVLAMANWPTVDPSNPADADPEALGNMATGFTYEPGSTFKAFTVSAALMEHLVSPSTMFDLPVELQVADRTITGFPRSRPGEPDRRADPGPIVPTSVRR